jgi:hypothetical protein
MIKFPKPQLMLGLYDNGEFTLDVPGAAHVLSGNVNGPKRTPRVHRDPTARGGPKPVQFAGRTVKPAKTKPKRPRGKVRPPKPKPKKPTPADRPRTKATPFKPARRPGLAKH